MKAYLSLLVVAFSLPLANVFFAASPEATGKPEPETGSAEIISPSSAESSALPSEAPDEPEAETALPETSAPSTANDFFQRALEHAQKNEIDEAIADCSEAVGLDPENLEYLVDRAEFYVDAGIFDKALEDSAKVLAADSDNLRARVLSGKAYELSGNVDKALTEYNTAIERNPTNVEALVERQNYFLRQGQNDKAMADTDRIIQLQPDSPAGYASKALIQEGSGQFDQGMSYSSALIQRYPEGWVGYKLRGSARAAKGDFTGAMDDFETALKLSPDNALVYGSRALLYLRTGDYDRSVADLQKAQELQPHNPAMKASLADILATCPDDRVRNGKKASQYAAEAVKLAPNDPFVWIACASAAAENGNYEEATTWQERVRESQALLPALKAESEARLKAYKSGEPYRNDFAGEQKSDAVRRKMKDADEAIKNNNFDRAIALFSEVIAADGKKAAAYTRRGFAYYKQKKYDLAVADFSAAILINPKDAEAYVSRAHLFEEMGKYAKAFDDLLLVEKLGPNLGAGIYNNLAWFFATCPDDAFRNGTRAEQDVDRALELSPESAPVWDTCAAVLAENGDFEGAISWEKRCLDREDWSQEQRTDAEGRLALYEQHRGYRQPVASADSKELTASATQGQPGK